MTTRFQFKPLSMEHFSRLLAVKDNDNLPPGVSWLTVDAEPGYPCRVSLRDAPLGSRVLALSHLHHDVQSPYRASGPVFVHEHALPAQPAVDEVPEVCRRRLLSLRAYNDSGNMVDADTTMGEFAARLIQRLFESEATAYIQVHNAGPGCFSCEVVRA